MTYEELLEEAKKHISSKIVDYRPACGLYVDGMDDCEQIPRAIVCWLENGSQVIYINNDKGSDDMTEQMAKLLLNLSKHNSSMYGYELSKTEINMILKLFNDIKELEQYRALGTVEELKVARDKQVEKKPICKEMPYSEEVGFNEEWHCPTCGAYVGYGTEGMSEPEQMEYCNECGQHIARDWSDKDE